MLKVSTAAIVASGLALILPIMQPLSLGLLTYLCCPIFKSTWIQWHTKKAIGHDMLVSLLFIIGFVSGQLLALGITLFFYYLEPVQDLTLRVSFNILKDGI